jgi:hypothetical protein
MNEVVPNLVSTIIPVYNRPEWLVEAVQSVLEQTYRPIEIIVVDDGSTDGAGETADRLAAEHPGVVFSIRMPNRGAGPARETGRQAARGEFIQYLDSDDRLLPRKFEVMVTALRDHPECGAAYGWIRLCPEQGPPLDRPYKFSGRDIPHLFPALLADRWWNTDCPLFRRSVCDAVGPWSSLRYSQDWEYDARVGALGIRLIHCPEYVCEQRQHGGPRQTGGGRWLSFPDQVRFFTTLLDCATTAGVPTSAPECRHFGRWVFSHSRLAARAGDRESSDRLLALAHRALPQTPRDLRLYTGLRRLAGPRFAAIASDSLRRMLPGRTGSETMPFSWSSS